MRFHNEKFLLRGLKKSIEGRPSSQNLAVLDADGTLWPEDVNDILLDYEIQTGQSNSKQLETLPAGDDEAERAKRCALFASLQAGFSLEEFKALCLEALKQTPLRVFPFQRDLLGHLKQQGLSVTVVSASMKYLVETAIQCYDLPVDRVLGVETELKDGRLGAKILKPAPFSHFKGEVFLQNSQGKKPFIAGGNTLADLPLLEMAHTAFVVRSAKKGNKNFLSEKKLLTKALQNNWKVFQPLQAEPKHCKSSEQKV